MKELPPPPTIDYPNLLAQLAGVPRDVVDKPMHPDERNLLNALFEMQDEGVAFDIKTLAGKVRKDRVNVCLRAEKLAAKHNITVEMRQPAPPNGKPHAPEPAPAPAPAATNGKIGWISIEAIEQAAAASPEKVEGFSETLNDILTAIRSLREAGRPPTTEAMCGELGWTHGSYYRNKELLELGLGLRKKEELTTPPSIDVISMHTLHGRPEAERGAGAASPLESRDAAGGVNGTAQVIKTDKSAIITQAPASAISQATLASTPESPDNFLSPSRSFHFAELPEKTQAYLHNFDPNTLTLATLGDIPNAIVMRMRLHGDEKRLIDTASTLSDDQATAERLEKETGFNSGKIDHLLTGIKLQLVQFSAAARDCNLPGPEARNEAIMPGVVSDIAADALSSIPNVAIFAEANRTKAGGHNGRAHEIKVGEPATLSASSGVIRRTSGEDSYSLDFLGSLPRAMLNEELTYNGIRLLKGCMDLREKYGYVDVEVLEAQLGISASQRGAMKRHLDLKVQKLLASSGVAEPTHARDVPTAPENVPTVSALYSPHDEAPAADIVTSSAAIPVNAVSRLIALGPGVPPPSFFEGLPPSLIKNPNLREPERIMLAAAFRLREKGEAVTPTALAKELKQGEDVTRLQMIGLKHQCHFLPEKTEEDIGTPYMGPHAAKAVERSTPITPIRKPIEATRPETRLTSPSKTERASGAKTYEALEGLDRSVLENPIFTEKDKRIIGASLDLKDEGKPITPLELERITGFREGYLDLQVKKLGFKLQDRGYFTNTEALPPIHTTPRRLVQKHPVTRRKYFFNLDAATREFAGLSDSEADAFKPLLNQRELEYFEACRSLGPENATKERVIEQLKLSDSVVSQRMRIIVHKWVAFHEQNTGHPGRSS